MPHRLLRRAVLFAGLAIVPAAASSAPAADEPAKEQTKEARPGQPSERPARRGDPGAAADGAGRGQLDPAAMVERMRTTVLEMELSPLQKRTLEAAFDEAKKSLAAQKPAAADADPQERMRQVRPVMAALRTAIDDALTEEQKKALAEKLPMLGRGGRPGAGPGAERPGRPGEGRPGAGRPGANRPGAGPAGDNRLGGLARAADAALAKLDLSDEQKAKVKAVNENVEKKTREALSEAGGDRDQIGEKLRPIMEERREKLAEILSPEQMTKFQSLVREEMEKLRGEGGPAAGRPGAGRPGAARPGRPGSEGERGKKDGNGEDEKG